MKRFKLGLVLSVALLLLGSAFVQSALAMPRSQKIAMVPSATGQDNFGGELPTTGIPGAPGVPTGYAPVFANLSPAAIADGTIPNPIAAGQFDTVALVGICDIATKLSDPDFKTRIEGFVSLGGKLIIWDSECAGTNYSQLVYPFTSNSPGPLGATGTMTDVEENTLSSTNSSNPSYVDDSAVATQTDAVGDANVMTSFDEHWCVDLKATNFNNVTGPVQTYAHLGSGLMIYNGLDKDFTTNSSPSFDSASLINRGRNHLHRIWLLQLLQQFRPDNLPCAVKVFGLSLSPKTASNPCIAGTPHTVTAHVERNGSPAAGVMVTFLITSGPNKGQTGTATTDANGNASFTYTLGTMKMGTDTIKAGASLTGPGGQERLVSDTATKTWEPPPMPVAQARLPARWTLGGFAEAISPRAGLAIST